MQKVFTYRDKGSIITFSLVDYNVHQPKHFSFIYSLVWNSSYNDQLVRYEIVLIMIKR